MRISSIKTYVPQNFNCKAFGSKLETEPKYEVQNYTDSAGYKCNILKKNGILVKEEKVKDAMNHGFYSYSEKTYYDDGKIKTQYCKEYENYVKSESFSEYDRNGKLVRYDSDVDASDGYEAFSTLW